MRAVLVGGKRETLIKTQKMEAERLERRLRGQDCLLSKHENLSSNSQNPHEK